MKVIATPKGNVPAEGTRLLEGRACGTGASVKAIAAAGGNAPAEGTSPGGSCLRKLGVLAGIRQIARRCAAEPAIDSPKPSTSINCCIT